MSQILGARPYASYLTSQIHDFLLCKLEVGMTIGCNSYIKLSKERSTVASMQQVLCKWKFAALNTALPQS